MRAAPFALAALCGCGTLSGARPLAPGHHEVGVSLGGPLLAFGGAGVPTPNVVVGARSGVTEIGGRPLDVGYGTNLTGLPFGIVSAYGDVGYLLVEQRGAVPAVAVRNKLLLTTNLVAAGRDPELAPRTAWAADQVDVLASWEVGGSGTLVYGAVGQVFDFADPGLILAPALGADIDFGAPGGVRLQPELRWWAVNEAFEQRNIPWLPGSPGALGVHVGLVAPIGGGR